MREQLRCRSCRASLSNPVRMGRPAPPAGADGLEAKKPPCPPGQALLSPEPWSRTLKGPPGPLEFAPQVWMRLDDLLPSVGLSTDPGRLNGCCGLDGADGPNRVCACGAAVGTELSDCWTPHMVIPDPRATYWTKV